MKVSEFIESRRENWRELEALCTRIEPANRRAPDASSLARFAALYRAACADLALADAYQLPPETVQYLHRLVGRAHNRLYRSQGFNFDTWARQLLIDVPQRLFNDSALRLAFFIFWGTFLLSLYMSHATPGFAEAMVGKEYLMMIEESFSKPEGGLPAGFYLFHNAGIGLKCFAFGLAFGVGGLYATFFNAGVLGAVFGYMAHSQHRENFFHFVTAHGPFELTAIVLSAAAGMRLGFSLVQTNGWTRLASLRRAADQAMPTMWAAIVMFLLAAMIESWLSPSSAPYAIKALVAVLSAGLLMVYFVALGYPRGDTSAVGTG